jgi:hypothetical protein
MYESSIYDNDGEGVEETKGSDYKDSNVDNMEESKKSAIKMSVFPEFTVPTRVLRGGISPLVLPSRVVRGVRPCFFETEEQLESDNIEDGYGGIRKSALEDSYG